MAAGARNKRPSLHAFCPSWSLCASVSGSSCPSGFQDRTRPSAAKCSRQGGPGWPWHAFGGPEAPSPSLSSFQVAEMRRTLTPANSPVSSPSKHGDRFIPSRAGANWSVNFHRINVRAPEGRGQGRWREGPLTPQPGAGARPFQLSSVPQENEKSPSQNRKAKDATSDNGKGQQSEPQTPPFTPTLCLVRPRPSLSHAWCPQTAWLTRPC